MTDFAAYTPIGEIRASAILTTSYVVAKEFGLRGAETNNGASPLEINNESTSLVLDVAFTKGSLTSCSIKIEFSTDGVNWFQEASESTAAGVSTISPRTHLMSADFTGTIAIAITHPFIRVSAIGAGTVTSSALAISAHFIRKIS